MQGPKLKPIGILTKMIEATQFASFAFSPFQKGCAGACSSGNCHIVMSQRAPMLHSYAFIPCQVSNKAGSKATACLPVAKHAVYVEVDRGKCMCSMYTYRIVIRNSGKSASRNQNKDL